MIRYSLSSVADLLDCPHCGGLHAVPWCPSRSGAGALPQTALTFTEAQSIAPHSVPLPAPVNLDLWRATQEELF